MTPKQAILAALNEEIKRPQLLEYCGIVKKGDKYVYKRKESIKRTFVPPSVNEVIAFFRLKGYSDIGARKAFEYYSIANWKDAKGNQIINWKQKMIGNWFRDEFKVKAPMYKTLNID